MGSFRIGRKFAQHVYPEPRRGSGAAEFARNFATVKDEPFGVSENILSWNMDVGAPSPGQNIPITPLSTGFVEIHGLLLVHNNDGSSHLLEIEIAIDGVPVASVMDSGALIPANSQTSIPFQAQVEIPISATAQVTVIVTTTGDVGMGVDAGSIAIQEVPAPTG